MPSVFPGALDNIPSNKLNSTVSATDHPDHHNLLADAVNAIEATLGAGLSNVVTSVGATAPITSTGGSAPTIGVTSAALTKTDDTNVTLTLGGSPTTALLAATSLTLGWTGQLSPARGGTGVNNGTRTLTVNTFSGTLDFFQPSKTLTITDNASISAGNNGDVSLFSDSGLEFAGTNPQQDLRLGTPTTITSVSTNSVTGNSHTHAITGSVRLLGNGTAQYQIPVTGVSPFVPAYVTATGTGAPVLAASPSLTGSVGINQPSPATALDVVGSATISTGINVGTATGALAGQISQKASVGTLANILDNTSTSVNVSAGFVFRLDNQANNEEFRLVFNKNSAGADTGTGTLLFRKQSVDGTTFRDLMQITGDNNIALLAGASAGSPDPVGKVGIYTTTPSFDLSFSNGAAREISIEATAAGTAGRAFTLAGGNTTAGSSNIAGGTLFLESGLGTGSGASNIIFRTPAVAAVATDLQGPTPTERMRITNAGDVGIGTNSPSAQARLHIDKDITPTATGVVNGFLADIGVTGHSSGGTDARTFNLFLTASGANNIANQFGAYVNASNNLDATKTVTTHYTYAGSPRITGAGASTNMGGVYVEPLFSATATGTVTNYHAFRSVDWNYVVGATSTITNAYGLYLEALYNATYSTNAWGVYQAGASDNNYFAGEVRVGSVSGIGGNMSVWNGLYAGANDSTAEIQTYRASTNSGGPFNYLNKARGTIASPTVVASGDDVGSLIFRGYDGAAYRTAAQIVAQVDGGPASGDMPGRLVFYTTPDATTTPTERMRITQGGIVAIGTSSPAASAAVDITSTTGALIVPRMTTAQRDALTAVNGMIIYNSTTNTMQGRINGAWANM